MNSRNLLCFTAKEKFLLAQNETDMQYTSLPLGGNYSKRSFKFLKVEETQTVFYLFSRWHEQITRFSITVTFL